MFRYMMTGGAFAGDDPELGGRTAAAKSHTAWSCKGSMLD